MGGMYYPPRSATAEAFNDSARNWNAMNNLYKETEMRNQLAAQYAQAAATTKDPNQATKWQLQHDATMDMRKNAEGVPDRVNNPYLAFDNDPRYTYEQGINAVRRMYEDNPAAATRYADQRWGNTFSNWYNRLQAHGQAESQAQANYRNALQGNTIYNTLTNVGMAVPIPRNVQLQQAEQARNAATAQLNKTQLEPYADYQAGKGDFYDLVRDPSYLTKRDIPIK